MVRTYVSSVQHQFGQTLGSPNSGGSREVTERLGREAVVVLIQHLHSPSASPFTPDASVEGRLWGTHEDAQNPGWDFREELVCEEGLCASVIVWWGPKVSTHDLASALAVANSITF